jgi:hypothetical protein
MIVTHDVRDLAGAERFGLRMRPATSLFTLSIVGTAWYDWPAA